MAKVNPIQVQKFLKGLNYPAKKEHVVQHAREQGADESVVEVLEKMPDKQYQTPADVSRAIGGVA